MPSQLRPASSHADSSLSPAALRQGSLASVPQVAETSRDTVSDSFTQASDVRNDSQVAPLGELMDAASKLNNAGKPREALALLVPRQASEEALNHFAFQARLGAFHMAVADELVAGSRLGALVAVGHTTGLTSQVPERIACYMGVLGAHGRYLELLDEPATQRHFAEKNPTVDLRNHRARVQDGLQHATLEIGHLYMGLRDALQAAVVSPGSQPPQTSEHPQDYKGDVQRLVEQLVGQHGASDRLSLLRWNEEQRAQFLGSDVYRTIKPRLLMAPDFLFLPLPVF